MFCETADALSSSARGGSDQGELVTAIASTPKGHNVQATARAGGAADENHTLRPQRRAAGVARRGLAQRHQRLVARHDQRITSRARISVRVPRRRRVRGVDPGVPGDDLPRHRDELRLLCRAGRRTPRRQDPRRAARGDGRRGRGSDGCRRAGHVQRCARHQRLDGTHRLLVAQELGPLHRVGADRRRGQPLQRLHRDRQRDRRRVNRCWATPASPTSGRASSRTSSWT